MQALLKKKNVTRGGMLHKTCFKKIGIENIFDCSKQQKVNNTVNEKNFHYYILILNIV